MKAWSHSARTVLVIAAIFVLSRSLCWAQSVCLDGAHPRLRALMATDEGSTRTLAVQKCIADSLRSLAPRCTRPVSNGTLSAVLGTQPLVLSLPALAQQAVRKDAMNTLMRSCIDTTGTSGTPAVKMLMVTGEYSNLLQNVTSLFSYLVGSPVQLQLEPSPTYTTVSRRSMMNAGNISATHSLWMVSMSSIGEGLASAAIKNLTDLVLKDRRTDWLDLLPVLRTSGLLYGTSVVGLPWLANIVHLTYRRDMFARYQWQPPDTWDELIEFARMFNGTEGMHGLCVGFGPCQRITSILLRYIVASLIQTGGPRQGWGFNPDTMEPLLGSRAMEEALRIYKALLDISGPDTQRAPDCSVMQHGFVRGKCIMSIHSTGLTKMASHVSSKDTMKLIHGKIGVTILPGTEQVLDMSTKTMVPCDPKRCPYALLLTSVSGVRRWVSKCAHIDIVNLSLNQQSPPDVTLATFTMASLITSSAITDSLLYNPAADFYPSRYSHMNYSRWVRAGYNMDDIAELLDATNVALSHPNAVLQIRLPGASTLFSTTFTELARNVTSPNNTLTFQEMARDIDARAQSFVADQSKAGFAAFRDEYWVSLNREVVPSPQPSPAPALVEQQIQDNSTPPGIIAVATAVPAVFVVAVVLAIVYWRKGQLKRHGKFRSHPGPGPLTTLLVSDIESSTLLWEQLDAEVMDAAVKLHNGCIRNLAADHHGYETQWEGDSFVIAFHKPSDALQFSVAAQKELLSVAWPSALLNVPLASEVWVKSLGGKTKTIDTLNFELLNTNLKQRSATGMCSEDRAGSDTPTNTIPTGLGASGYEDRNVSTASGEEAPASDPFACTPEVNILMKKSEHEMIRPASVAGSVFTTTTLTSGHAQLGQRLQSAWKVVEAGSPGAVLIYRGLRVRMGMHSGLNSPSDINFNNLMGRYHYSGPLRVAANAIASAAHGGQILVSDEVAALLEPDALGMLRLLPSGCHVYHLGDHELSDMPGQTTELILVLPSSLKARIILKQESLRTQLCVVPSIYLAPVPSGIPGCPTLVFVRAASLELLCAWNLAVTVQATQQLHACIRKTVSSCRGVVSENSLSACIRNHGSMLGKGQSSAQYVVAFPDAHSALLFSLSLRYSLLHLDWPAELLTHALCEQLGDDTLADVDEDMANILFSLTAHGERSMPGFTHPLKSKQLTAGPDLFASSILDSNPEQYDYSQQLRTLSTSASQSAGVLSGFSGSTSTVAAGGPSFLLLKKYIGKTHPFRYMGTGMVQPSPSQPQPSVLEVAQAALPGQAQGAKATAHQPILFSTHAMGPCHIVSPSLRGLRIRQCVVSGDMKVSIHTQGSGRVVYQGKAIKTLTALMSATKAGQIGLSLATVKALLQGPI